MYLILLFCSFPFASPATRRLLMRAAKLGKYGQKSHAGRVIRAESQSSMTPCDRAFVLRPVLPSAPADAELTVNVWVDVCNCQIGWAEAEKEAEGLW